MPRPDCLSFPEMLNYGWEEKAKRAGETLETTGWEHFTAPKYGKNHMYQIQRKHKEPVTPHYTPAQDAQEAEQISHILADNSLGRAWVRQDP